MVFTWQLRADNMLQCHLLLPCQIFGLSAGIVGPAMAACLILSTNCTSSCNCMYAALSSLPYPITCIGACILRTLHSASVFT